jgi:hypothetical protein
LQYFTVACQRRPEVRPAAINLSVDR